MEAHNHSTPAPSLPQLMLTPEEEQVVRTVLEALRRIQHGSVQVIVQDSRVVQIDTVEKNRFSRIERPS